MYIQGDEGKLLSIDTTGDRETESTGALSPSRCFNAPIYYTSHHIHGTGRETKGGKMKQRTENYFLHPPPLPVVTLMC